MKTSILIIFILAFYLSACYPEKDYYTMKTDSYVLFYHKLEKINIISHEPGIIQLCFNAASDVEYSKSKNYSIYRSLCEKHNDITYDRKVKVSIPSDHNRFMAQDFVSIEIQSDQDFDDEHPVGSSLGDITTFYSMSPYKYIQSGYQKEFDWPSFEFNDFYVNLFYVSSTQNRSTLYPVYEFVSDLNYEQLKILGTGEVRGITNTLFGYIKFTQYPETEMEHNITVTMTDDEGRVYESSVIVNFE
ncbi:MAG: hypothetical protein LUE26_12645 [Alistipes sp.]|nr:hypothetical protein [Alistipes sp.]